ncbi:MAG TPA: hypothetical protein VEF53_08380 [Patescibacteria group bacterium]|nr:hypothetical protein [Patescibacteria group bacterium]
MNSYVNLPEIVYLKINNFELYKDKSFEWSFNNNFNLFLGINGLGKTTTLSLIAYALVGLVNKTEKDENNDNISKNEIEEFTEILEYGITDKNYFKRYKGQKGSTVSLKLKIADNSFELTRDMLNHHIIKLSINGNEINGNLDSIYEKQFEVYSGISIQNFTRIVYTLFIRYEEAPSLLFRPRTQHTALRTLFFDSAFHDKFLKAERSYRSLNGDFRRYSDKLRNLQKEIIENENFCNKKSEELAEFKLSSDTQDIQRSNEISRLQSGIQGFDKIILDHEKEIRTSEELLKELNLRYNNLVNKKNKIDYEIDVLDEEILLLQNELYSDIYSSNSIYNLAINSLKYRDCIFCGSHIQDEDVRKLEEEVSKNKCPFCHSKINNYDGKNDINKFEIDEKLENKRHLAKTAKELSSEIDTMNSRINSCNEKYGKLYKELTETRMLQLSYNKQLNELLNNKKSRQYDILENELKEAKRKSSFLIEKFEKDSFTIYGCKVDYKTYNSPTDARKAIGGIDLELFKAEECYNSMLEESKDGIRKFEKNIIEKFNKYNILAEEYTLEVQQAGTTDTNIAVKYNIFIPISIQEGSNAVRDKINKVSKSEQVVLDYAFRMALVEYYCEITGNKEVFIAFETSEGVFDFQNVLMFCDILKKYANDNKILLISNLSNSEFLKSVLNIDLPNSNKSILNFIEVSGKKNIEGKRKFFEKRLSELSKGAK